MVRSHLQTQALLAAHLLGPGPGLGSWGGLFPCSCHAPAPAWAEAPPPVNVRHPLFWAFAPDVFSPWGAFPWRVPLENAPSQLLKLPHLRRRCDPLLPRNPAEVHVVSKERQPGAH